MNQISRSKFQTHSQWHNRGNRNQIIGSKIQMNNPRRSIGISNFNKNNLDQL